MVYTRPCTNLTESILTLYEHAMEIYHQQALINVLHEIADKTVTKVRLVGSSLSVGWRWIGGSQSAAGGWKVGGCDVK